MRVKPTAGGAAGSNPERLVLLLFFFLSMPVHAAEYDVEAGSPPLALLAIANLLDRTISR